MRRFQFMIMLALSVGTAKSNSTTWSVIAAKPVVTHPIHRAVYHTTHRTISMIDTAKMGDVFTLSSIRTLTASYDGQQFMLDAGDRSGIFRYVQRDVKDPDDSVMILVTKSGQRLQRVVNDGIYARWFGTHVNTSADSWPAMQKAIDFIIAHPGEYSQNLITGAGYFHFSRPLICARWRNGAYRPFSINIEGESRFSEASGYGTTWYFDFDNAFGIGFQLAKGASLSGIKMIGQWSYKFPGAYAFYNSTVTNFNDGHSRNAYYSPNAAIAVDPFGTHIPSDGGYPGLSTWYRGSGTGGSTGVQLTNLFLSKWNIGIITSPNGQTANAELLTIRDIQVEDMRIGFAGCQSQEKLNSITNVQCWGVVHTLFATGVYGGGSIGSWNIDLVNAAGYTNELVYNRQSGYFPSYFSRFYCESIARIGDIYSVNGTTFSNSTINFAGYKEAGSYTEGMISGLGLTFQGCQLRLYGQFSPVTINSLEGLIHFRDCSFDQIPFYPQTYAYGYSDFSNCTIGGPMSSGQVLNPIGPQTVRPGVRVFAYGTTSNVAAKAVAIDAMKHKFSKTGPRYRSVIHSDSAVKIGSIVVATADFVDYRVAGIVSDTARGNFTISYSPAGIDTSKAYHLYRWVPVMK
ncbi:MAG: hypothetical protein Q8918_18335 [Bacteroidota bacterium]|nr:hypothetical protein [Bacteroidota bacterium]MDP4252064.1 hypothetical protein [Bacteroidota bacterium]